MAPPNGDRERLVILGSGFGSFSLLKSIDLRRWEITVVSPRNHFLFTPLLPSTTVGTLEFRSVIEPVRTARRGIAFVQGSAEDVDAAARSVVCSSETGPFTLTYDTLIVGVGADVQTFGIPGVREYALFLKEVSDARAIRQRFLECLDAAAHPGRTAEERARLLQFVIVGGGPTGVEFAAELHDFLREDARTAFPTVWNDVRIVLLEAGSQILSTFDTVLSDYTLRLFRRQKIDVRTGSPVVSIEKDRVTLKDGTTVPFGLLVWSGGVAPRTFTRRLSFRKDNVGRLLTDGSLRVLGERNVYALGDCAAVEGIPHPMTAQVAQQQGAYLARALNSTDRSNVSPFRFRYYGMLAYVGENKALADLSRIKARGFFSFLFWRSAYLTRLVGFRNKLLVVFDWCKTLVFGRDISRF